jgi:hypothetical protein
MQIKTATSFFSIQVANIEFKKQVRILHVAKERGIFMPLLSPDSDITFQENNLVKHFKCKMPLNQTVDFFRNLP